MEESLPNQEINSSINDTQKEIVSQKEASIDSITIIPTSKLWMGYIELDNNKHHQKIFSKPFDLDITKEWLLLLGHGNVNIKINGEIKKFNTKNNLRFLYMDGEFKEITTEEFKRLNKGSKW
jgi:hypothetical protein